MSLFKHLLVVTIASSFIAGCGKKDKETEWGIFQEPIKTIKLPAAVGEKQLEELWKKNIGASGDAGYAILKPAVSEHSVFVSNRKGSVQRLDISTGNVVWKTDLKKDTFAGVGIGQGLALVALDTGVVVALNEDTGAEQWSVEIGRHVSAIPAAGEDRVVVRTADGLLLGLDAANGQTIWSLQRTVPGLSIHGDSSSLITGETVITGLSNGKVTANAVANGREFWETDLSFVRGTNELERLSDVDSQPLVVDQRLYAATYQGDVVSVDLTTSSIAWRNKISTRLPMSVDSEKVYVTNDLGQLSAISADDGLSLWTQPAFQGRGISNPIGIGDRVVIGDAGGNIYLLDAVDGKFLQSKKASKGAIVSLARTSEGFVAFSVKGGVVAFKIN